MLSLPSLFQASALVLALAASTSNGASTDMVGTWSTGSGAVLTGSVSNYPFCSHASEEAGSPRGEEGEEGGRCGFWSFEAGMDRGAVAYSKAQGSLNTCLSSPNASAATRRVDGARAAVGPPSNCRPRLHKETADPWLECFRCSLSRHSATP